MWTTFHGIDVCLKQMLQHLHVEESVASLSASEEGLVDCGIFSSLAICQRQAHRLMFCRMFSGFVCLWPTVVISQGSL